MTIEISLTDNSRNGYSKKSLKGSSGIIDISVPTDRDNEFEPQIIKKNQNSIKILPVAKEWKERPLEATYAVVLDAISAVYLDTEIQQCIIYQIRNTTRYVSYKDIKAL